MQMDKATHIQTAPVSAIRVHRGPTMVDSPLRVPIHKNMRWINQGVARLFLQCWWMSNNSNRGKNIWLIFQFIMQFSHYTKCSDCDYTAHADFCGAYIRSWHNSASFNMKSKGTSCTMTLVGVCSSDSSLVSPNHSVHNPQHNINRTAILPTKHSQ